MAGLSVSLMSRCASARFHQENAENAKGGPGLGIEAKEGADNMSAGKKKRRIGSSFSAIMKDEGLDQEASAVRSLSRTATNLNPRSRQTHRVPQR
jgi:hypothetical protein